MDLQCIPNEDVARILRRIGELRENPRPTGCEKLSGQERYRIRQGIYRIVYEVTDEYPIVTVVKVGHRKLYTGAANHAVSQSIGLVSLVVRDYDEALDFFVGKLGFELIEDTYVPEQDKRWVVVGPKGGGAGLLLARASDDTQASCIGSQTRGRVFLFLYTDDFWRDYRAFVDKGVEFVREPKTEPYGTVAVFKDNYGNQWDLLEPGGDNRSWQSRRL